MKSVTPVSRYDHTLAHVRAGFVAQGTSLHGWCKRHGIDSQNARKALSGQWKGPKASALVERVTEASKGIAA